MLRKFLLIALVLLASDTHCAEKVLKNNLSDNLEKKEVLKEITINKPTDYLTNDNITFDDAINKILEIINKKDTFETTKNMLYFKDKTCRDLCYVDTILMRILYDFSTQENIYANSNDPKEQKNTKSNLKKQENINTKSTNLQRKENIKTNLNDLIKQENNKTKLINLKKSESINTNSNNLKKLENILKSNPMI